MSLFSIITYVLYSVGCQCGYVRSQRPWLYVCVFYFFYDHTYVLHANLLCTLKKDPCACQPDKIHPAAKRGTLPVDITLHILDYDNFSTQSIACHFFRKYIVSIMIWQSDDCNNIVECHFFICICIVLLVNFMATIH